jgi:hypothetical protein
MANRRYIDFPIAASVGNNDIVLIWQDGLNKQTTKETLLQGSPQSLAGLTDVDISALNNGQILQYNSTTSKWENVDRTDINLSELGDVTIVAPANGQVLVYNSSTGKWENSSGGYVPYTGAVTTVNLGAQTIQAGSFVKAGGTSAQFLKADGSVDSSTYGTGTVTSVALTMPSAFSVGGSPITTAGTLAVTGAGTVGQYIRGDGSLADFPATTGGGSSVSYYLNGSVSQGTIGGVAYKELNRTPVFGTGTDISINADGYIASFITDALDPNKLLIPGGNWNFETYFSASSSGGNPSFYIELYKYDGTTFTLLATSSSAPELIAFGTNLNPYFSTLAVPETVLALTDRLAVRFYVTHSGRTITLHTENGHLCQVITTFTTGLTALNGLTNQVQFFAVGTSGTDFAISSASDTHTFNLPTATSTIRGALSSADWSTFNGKQNALTLTTTGTSGAATLVGSTLNIPQYQAAGTYVTAVTASSPLFSSGGTTPNITIQQASGSQSGFLSSTDWTTFNNKQNALTNPVTGTGTTNYLPKFTGTSTIGNSILQDSGTRLTQNSGDGFAISTSSSDTVGSGSFLALTNLAQTRWMLQQLNASFGLDWWSFNGTSWSTRMQLTAGGNLLVGTTTDAGFKLQVDGEGRFYQSATNSSAYLRVENNRARNAAVRLKTTVGDFYIGTGIGADVNQFQLFDGNAGENRLTISSTGAATFSSSVTANGLNALGSTLNNGNAFRFYRAGLVEMAYIGWSNENTNNSTWLFKSSNGNPIAFSADATNQQLIVNTNGNVLIGTTTDNGAKLQVSGNTFISGFTSNALTNHGERFIPLGGPNSVHSFNVASQFPSLSISGNVLGVRMYLTIFGSGGSVYSAIATISRNAQGSWSAYGLTAVTSTASLLQSITGSGTTITINTNSGSYVGLSATAIIQ